MVSTRGFQKGGITYRYNRRCRACAKFEDNANHRSRSRSSDMKTKEALMHVAINPLPTWLFQIE